jgi:hypothetical protein
MTTAQEILLAAAKAARAYFDAKTKGTLGVSVGGMYSDIFVGRQLTAAIEAVEAEDRQREEGAA